MKKNKKTLVIAGLVALAVCLSLVLVLFMFRQDTPEPTEPQPTSAPVEHSIYVKTSKGDPLEDIAVYVYTNSERTDLAWFNKTDADGKMTFTDIPSDSYVAVLENVPTGYGVDEYYPLTGVETEIILSVGQMTEENMQSLTYQLGDLVMDFSVTATDGTVYLLSELLQEKQAVVLNFWYLDCQPCLQEFPFLQEAYAEYSDRIAVLGMNPVDKVEDIAAFQQEMGYTFPMAAVDPSWIDIMKISAFPTTVVIDRYGNITLIHTGSIDNAQTFKDVFEYFCAEEYEQKLIKDITELESEKEEGTEENPEELGGVANFEVTVGPGEVYYTELYKVTDMYLTIYSKHAYVIYNDRTYEPQNGVISVLLKCPDVSTPVNVGIGNSSEEEQTFKVYLVPKAGTFNNPYQLPIGEFTAYVEAGNEAGIYYIYTAQEDGALAIQCLNATPGVKYSYYLYNLNSYAMRNLEEDGQPLENGRQYIYIQARKGEQVQFSIGTLPDETNSYPGGSFQMLSAFISANPDSSGNPGSSGGASGSGGAFGDLENGFVMEEERKINDVISYTVTLKDQHGKGIPGVSIQLFGTVTEMDATATKEAVTQEIDQFIVTDSSGKATLTSYPGTLEGKIRIPEGYTLENNKIVLSAENPSVTVTLNKIEYKDYSVKVVNPVGDPVSNLIVVLNGKVAYTNEQGSAVFNLPDGSYTALVLGVPSEYTLADNTYELTADAPEVVVDLSYAPGHETNPIEIRDQAKIKVEGLAAGASRYYSVYGVGGTTLDMELTNGYILINGTKYEPQEVATGENGDIIIHKITVELDESEEPISLAVVNTDTKTQKVTVNFQFPLGTKYNPEQIKNRGSTVKISDTVESYYLYYQPAANVTDGTFNVSVTSSTGDDYDIIVSNGDQTAKLSESDNDTKVTLEFVSNKKISIQIVATNPLSEEITVSLKPSVDPRTGATYTVNLVNPQGDPLPGIQIQFMQRDEAFGGVFTTDSDGKVETALPLDSYTVKLLDESYKYDKLNATLTASKKTVTIEANQIEELIPEGMTRYKVMVTDYLGNAAKEYLVLFVKDGEPVTYNLIGENGGITTADLETGTYEIQLAFLGETPYYYVQSTAVVTEQAPELTVKVAAASTAVPEEHWELGQITPLKTGGIYVKPQMDVNTFFGFTPTEQGVYRIAISDPDAVLSYWGSPNYPMDSTAQLKDFDGTSFTVEVNTNELGQTHLIGIQGKTGCILSVIRVGDAVEDIPFTPYELSTAPVAQTLAAGLNFTYLDITKPTGTYNLVYNTTDGYYHMGSKNGPIVYVQLDYKADGTAAPYVTLYDMVGGVGNTGTAFRCIYTDAAGNEVREDYTAAMLSYGACADDIYGVYPLTKDLAYMIQMGGKYLGWWDANNANSQILFTGGENLEIAWMFAFCYVG